MADASELVAVTRNFFITCTSGDPDCETRANAIATRCEDDLAWLEQLFQVNYQVGGANQHQTLVNVERQTADSPGPAWNSGVFLDAPARIVVVGTWVPQVQPPNYSDIFASQASMLFVAELAELLMEFSHLGWAPYASDGEALSRVLATELYPAGYYATGRGPCVNNWLKAAPRPDWITTPEVTDKDAMSYGCGALFINFLRYQLGYSLESIVRSGGHFGGIYTSLTGGKVADAFTSFNGLIEDHLPAGSAPTKAAGNIVPTDNIFPLSKQTARAAALSIDYQTISGPNDPKPTNPRSPARPFPKRVKLKAGFACPERSYEYWTQVLVSEVEASAFGHGFLLARFDWSANGVLLPAHGRWATAELPGELYAWEPDGTRQITGDGTTVAYLITDSWNRSTLRVRNIQSIGDCDLDVVVRASEAAINDPPAEATGSQELFAVTYELEPAYYADRRICNPIFTALDRDIEALGQAILILKNLPDPPHDRTIFRTLIGAVERLQARTATAAESIGLPTGLVIRELDRTANLPSLDLPNAVSDDSQLKSTDAEPMALPETFDT